MHDKHKISLLRRLGWILLAPLLVACGGLQPTRAPTSPPASDIAATALPVEVTKDLVYAVRPGQPGASLTQYKLDMYAPAQPGRWPVVVFVHGTAATRETQSELMRAMAGQGLVAFSISYNAKHPITAVKENGRGFREMSETVACAVRFARARAADSGGDGTPMILVGHSLGGGVAAGVALTGDELETRWDDLASRRGGPPRQVECEVDGVSAQVDALVGIAGAYAPFIGYAGEYGREWLQAQDRELWAMFDSSLGMNPDLKVRLLHGQDDTEVPLESSVGFDAVLSGAGYDTRLVQYQGGHTLPLELTLETVLEAARD